MVWVVQEHVNPPSGLNNYLQEDKPAIFNFHGYPETLKSILFEYLVIIGHVQSFWYMATQKMTLTILRLIAMLE